jgi:hypothetical protein
MLLKMRLQNKQTLHEGIIFISNQAFTALQRSFEAIDQEGL